jgi:hypothetical protein
MLPVSENLSTDKKDIVNHYWLFVMNIRDRRFEVLDSLRTMADPRLNETVNNILAAVKTLWEENYAKSTVKLEKLEGPQDIRPPKQTNK